MNKINYQLELDREIDEIKKQGRVPSLLLHKAAADRAAVMCSNIMTKYF